MPFTKNKKIPIWVGILICILVVILLNAGNIYNQHSYQVKSVMEKAYKNDVLYGIDLSSEHYTVFKNNLKTGESDYFNVSNEALGGVVNLRGMAIDENNQAYIYKNIISRSNEKSMIAICDFKANKVEKFQDISKINDEDCEFWYIENSNNKVWLGLKKEYIDNDKKYIQYYQYVLNEEKKEFEQYSSFALPQILEPMFISKGEDVIYSDKLGNLYIIGSDDEDGKGKQNLIFKNDGMYKGEYVGKQNYNYNLVEDKIYFANYDNGKEYSICNFKNNPIVEEDNTRSMAAAKLGENQDSIRKPKYVGDGIWICDIKGKSNQLYLGYFGSESGYIKNLNVDIKNFLENSIEIVFQMIIVLVIVYLFIKLLIRYNRGVFPISIKMIIIMMAIVIVAGYFLNIVISNILTKTMLDERRETLYLVGTETKERIDIEKFKNLLDNGVENNLDYVSELNEFKKEWETEVYKMESLMKSSFEIWSTESKKGYKGNIDVNNPLKDNITIESNDFRIIIGCKNGENYSITDNYGYYMPLKYMSSNLAENAIKKSIEEKINVSVVYDNGVVRCLAVFMPIIDNGKVIGVVESGIELQEEMVKIAQNKLYINALIALIMIVLATVLFVIVIVSLRPLEKLRKAVNDMADGILDVQVKTKGNSEISEISAIFNRMSLNISENVAEMRDFVDKYSAFVPKQVFELLGKKDVRTVELGNEVEVMCTVMSINTNEFIRRTPYLTAKEMFGFINESLNMLVPIVQEKNGIVDQFVDAGMEAFFTGGVMNCLDSAILIMQKIHREPILLENKPVNFQIAICKGNIKLGIVGHDSRMAPEVISEYNNLAEYLQNKAEEFGAKIIITDYAAKEIKNFRESYHTRMLGYIYINSTKTLEKIYDVFDGDTEKYLRYKINTKDIFEQGVEEFMAGKFMEARRSFVEVLTINKKDYGAQKYFYLCDCYLQEKDQNKIRLYMDSY